MVLQAKVRQSRVKEERKKQQKSWVVNDMKEPPSPTAPPQPNPAMARPTPKPVDEDLYTLSPQLLYAKPNKACMHALGFFWRNTYLKFGLCELKTRKCEIFYKKQLHIIHIHMS